MANESFDAIVVGAGFGGSACAGLLAKKGLKTLLVEKNQNAGGKAMSIAYSGYTHTPWVVIGAPVIGNLYQVLLDELEVADMAELVFMGIQDSIYKNSTGKYVNMPPMPEEGMDPNVLFEWLEIAEEEREAALVFFTELSLMPPEQIETYQDVCFDKYLKDSNVHPNLYAFICSLCCDGMFMVSTDILSAAEAIKSLQDMFLRNGGVFCKGGFGRIAEAYCEAVRKNGSTVIMEARTEKILIENGKVTGVQTSKGTFNAPIVISNAGIQPTILKLAGEDHFDKSYVNYVKDLMPSLSLVGYRYYMNKQIVNSPFGVVFSNTSPWSIDRFAKARTGDASREGVLYVESPTIYDPDAAPEGKHIVMTGTFCAPDPEISEEELMAWVEQGEKILFEVYPDFENVIEEKVLYTTKDVSRMTRDSAVPGIGGETIGLGQTVEQCGPYKPSIEAPVQGLYLVGCDAGADGVGTQQAIASGMKVADAVEKYHFMQKSVS